jgi:hypothetical protein
MSDAPRISYAPRPDATPEGELNALASVYRVRLGRRLSSVDVFPARRSSKEGGTDGTLTNDPNKQVASSRVKEVSSS